MLKKLKVTAVSYLNTKPLLYGLVKSGLSEELNLSLDIPSICASKLASGEADFGLIPVAAIPEIATPHIISDYCIGTVGEVKTVCIFSEVPMEQVTELYLDFHSRTSVELAKILLEKHWHCSPTLLPATPGFESKIAGTTAALIIGDRAMEHLGKHAFTYDLGEAWLAHTGLPFVFAAWVSNRPLPLDFIEKFNAAMQLGIESIPQLMLILPQQHPGFDLEKYFTENISYQLDAPKRKALELFLRQLPNGQMPVFDAESLVLG
ncbi:MAG: ABC transporter substrate-binding protein [Bacteroidetes bacterium]|nr:ABC transporter substrate-binding protein [Bacteroidota bacterium]